ARKRAALFGRQFRVRGSGGQSALSSLARLGDVVPPPFAPRGATDDWFICGEYLFYRHGFREVAWLVHVATATHRYVIREQLQRNDREDRRQQIACSRNLNHVIRHY